MCRIVGCFNFNSKIVSESVLLAMRDSLSHGGPDGAGNFIEGNIGLGHRRLSILDLSDAGLQPMTWNDWVICYNGEVYNFLDIRQKLIGIGYEFKTQTDTEVIIKAFDCWGKEAVKQFRGMFAFALWNKKTKTLLLCRDRLGVKPLYWYQKDDLFMFASELRAFYQHPSFDKEINKTAIPHYIQKGYIHPEQSIFRYVSKLPPGNFLELTEKDGVSISAYWSAKEIYVNTATDDRDEETVTAELENVLTESFNLRMVADVDVGVFLSGGVDSSMVTALLQKDAAIPLKTFTIGFEDKRYNESEVAEAIAKHLGTSHTTFYCTKEEFNNTIKSIEEIHDEPFGDTSVIPTFLLCREARKDVKVALSGDGADELFGGYAKYAFSRHAQSVLSIPYSVRKLFYNGSFLLNADWVEYLADKFGIKSFTQFNNKYSKFQQTLLAKSTDELFEFASSYVTQDTLQKLTTVDFNINSDQANYIQPEKLITYFGLKDLNSYLPGDILTKVDRASMHVALECREPFLDPKLIDFAFAIPDSLKIKNGKNKYLLRKILAKYVPDQLIERPKQGFTVPIDEWMKSFLKSELLLLKEDTSFFNSLGLNQTYFNEILHSYLSNKKKYNPHLIWFIYSLYKWYKKWVG